VFCGWGFGFRVSGFGFRGSWFGFRASGFVVRGSGFGFTGCGDANAVGGRKLASFVFGSGFVFGIAFLASGLLGWGKFTVQRFRGGLVFKAHRVLYHSTLGLRVIKKKKKFGVWTYEP